MVSAGSDLKITIRNDTESDGYNMTAIYGEENTSVPIGYERVYHNYIDCGVYIDPSDVPEDVIIEDCGSNTVVGYICIAGIPDLEAYDIHPAFNADLANHPELQHHYDPLR